ncbi:MULTISPECIES: hypothetical protein [unclassified Pseudomonas]|nr:MULTISPECIES: hypothetical protein [unclassified Pseudomonas]
MKKLTVALLFLMCAGCQYFGYQDDNCTNEPDQPACDGSHPVEGHRK